MKNPQLEDGYIRIANELWDALTSYRLPGEQMQCLMCIIRRTYGFNRIADSISLSQFQKHTGMKKSNICRALNGLIEKNVIKKDNGNITTYRLNKKYSSWKSLSKKITAKKALSKKIKIVIKNDKKSLSKKRHTKDTSKDIFKDTRTSFSSELDKSRFDTSSIPYLLSEILLNQIKGNLPDFKPAQNGIREKTLQRWAVDIDRMIRIDGRNPCKVMNMIVWCQHDTFWFKNIQSGATLRKQYDRLAANIQAELKKNRSQQDKLLEVGNKWLNKSE